VTLALTKFGKGGLEIVKSLKQHITPGISVDWTPQERTWEEEIIPSLNLPVDPKHLWEEILQIKDYKNLSNYIERMRQKALNEESLSDYEQGYIRIFYTIKEQLMNNMTQERMNALSQAKQQFISTAEKHFDFKDLESKGMVEKEQAMKRLESLAEWINQGLSPRDWKS
jgi:hypothetical protein